MDVDVDDSRQVWGRIWFLCLTLANWLCIHRNPTDRTSGRNRSTLYRPPNLDTAISTLALAVARRTQA